MRSLIAQIADSHISVGPGEEGPTRALAAAVEEILRMDPAPVAVLHTGDLVDTGAPDEYERALELLSPLPMPVHPLVGNHDDREELRAAFAHHPGVAGSDGPVQYAVDCGPVRVICCDTAQRSHDDGHLPEDRLAWIEAQLAGAGDLPVILAMHHPPLLTGIRELDEFRLGPEDRADLAEVLARTGASLEAIVGGHYHRAMTGSLSGRPVFVCPSVWLQARLDLSDAGRLALIPEPPGMAVHVFGADDRLVSHVVAIGRHA